MESIISSTYRIQSILYFSAGPQMFDLVNHELSVMGL